MTAPHPQQEPEYIITERVLFDWVLQDKISLAEAERVRSRPYNAVSERDRVLDDVIHEISTAAPEMEGKKLFITVLALCRRIDKLRSKQEPVGTDGLTDSEYEHKKLVEEIEILSKSLNDCHKLVKFKSKQELIEKWRIKMKQNKLIRSIIRRLPISMEKRGEVLEWFEKHPNCTPEELQKHFEQEYKSEVK